MRAFDEIAWGDHICQLYRTRRDLVETLVPFFAAGLRKRERCVWITDEPFGAADARAALRAEVPDLDARERRGQIEILDAESVYLRDGRIDADALIAGWLAREADAVRDGYHGLRVSGNWTSLKPEQVPLFVDYEARVHRAIQGKRIIALCSYCLDRCGRRDLVGMMNSHRFALARRGDRWDVVRSSTAVLALLQGDPQPQLHGHSAEFFRDGAFPATRIAATILGALACGMAAGAIARPGHLEALRGALRDAGVDLELLRDTDQLVLLDAEAVFESAWARPGLRTEVLAERVLAPVSRATSQFGRIQIYSELVDLFATAHDQPGAIALERWWSQQLARQPIELHCGYRLETFSGGIDRFHAVCDEHDTVRSSDASAPVPERLRAEVALLRAALAREGSRRNEVQLVPDHLTVLQRVMTHLGGVSTLLELSAVIAGEAKQTFGASRVALLAEDDDGRWRDFVTGELSPVAPPDGVHPLWLGSAGAVAREQPQLSELAPQAVAVLPLVARGRRVGVLVLGFAGERAFGAQEQALAGDLALQVAQTLDRTLACDAAERAVRAKDEFFAMIGHDLRAPLAPILVATQLMQQRDEVHCAKERTIIERQAKGLVRMIDDLLDVARTTRGRLGIERRRVDLGAVIVAAVEQTGPAFTEHGHHLELHVPAIGPALDLDPVRMTQVFANLLDNAARYTPHGGRIEVAAVAAARTVTITVRDNGAGIEPELLPQVFDAFVRGKHGERARGGLGLGLAIAKSIVGMHGGTICAASDGVGRGSAFTVELPYPHEEKSEPTSGGSGEEAAAAAARLESSRPRRLLLVDDNEDGVGLLALWLAKRGHDVRVAYHPRAALTIAREFRPDVAILDIGLPEMDGYDLAIALREQQPEAPIRMIALTGYGQPADRSRSELAGFAVHLVKPVDLAAFQDAIARRPERPS